jgi:hypothetical protein
LARHGHRLGRRRLGAVATIVTPDTILRWHRQLIARKWTFAKRRGSRPGVLLEIRRLAVRMAKENPTWGYTRIVGALKNVGHRVSRSTIARILKAHGIPPVPERPTSWQTFLQAHWDAIAGADFFTTEVWTWRGLVTYYTLFVIDLASRRIQIVGSTPYPDARFMRQVGRTLTAAEDGLLRDHRVLIYDRDRKWSRDVRRVLRKKSVRAKAEILTPSDHATDIRLGEIIALEQEGLARRAGQRVGENIAEIEAGGVTSLAEASVSPSRLGHLLRIDGDHDDLGLVDQRIEFAPTRLALPDLNDECRLEQCRR